MTLKILHEMIVLQEQQSATLCCTVTQLKAAVGLYQAIKLQQVLLSCMIS